uniref:Uncharacterized protein n=1 Tax=Cacopsylla melanoneura TaxID=428564 RepID=A0A8D9E8X9_9HEMI
MREGFLHIIQSRKKCIHLIRAMLNTLLELLDLTGDGSGKLIKHFPHTIFRDRCIPSRGRKTCLVFFRIIILVSIAITKRVKVFVAVLTSFRILTFIAFP